MQRKDWHSGEGNVFRLGIAGLLVIALVVAVGLTPQPVRAQDEPTAAAKTATDEKLPSGEELLNKLIDATGGKAAYEKIHNQLSKGTFEIVAMGIKGPVTVYEAEPAKQLVEIELPGMGIVRDGTNGEVAWEVSQMQGARIKQGAEAADALREARFNSLLHSRELYKSIECTGTEEVNGKPCYTVVLTPAEGNATTMFIDKDSGLVVQTKTIFSHQMGDIPVVSKVEDYRKVNGLMIPFSITQTMMGQAQKIALESIEHNVDMPADRFDLPGEIKSLLETPSKEEPASDEDEEEDEE